MTLTIMIACTALFVTACVLCPQIGEFQYEYWPLIIVAFVLIITIEISIFCFKSVARSSPVNVILLVIFTACFAYILGFLCYFYEPMAIYAAFLLTLAGFVGMTIYAFVTNTDLTIWWAWLFGIGLAFFAFGLIFFFVYNRILYLIYCLIGVILGMIYVAYDTQLIIGQKKYSISKEDYIAGAMMLYCDFVMIFLYLL